MISKGKDLKMLLTVWLAVIGENTVIGSTVTGRGPNDINNTACAQEHSTYL